MFTSNGLMCLSGVTMCRMFLSAMTVSSADRSLLRRDLGAAIEPCANADVQTLPVRVPARGRRKLVGLRFRGAEREAGRTPGALPDPERPLRLEVTQNRCDIGAAEAFAALCRREIVSQPCLQLRDGRTETRQVVLGRRRQRLHQNQAAQMRGI